MLHRVHNRVKSMSIIYVTTASIWILCTVFTLQINNCVLAWPPRSGCGRGVGRSGGIVEHPRSLHPCTWTRNRAQRSSSHRAVAPSRLRALRNQPDRNRQTIRTHNRQCNFKIFILFYDVIELLSSPGSPSVITKYRIRLMSRLLKN